MDNDVQNRFFAEPRCLLGPTSFRYPGIRLSLYSALDEGRKSTLTEGYSLDLRIRREEKSAQFEMLLDVTLRGGSAAAALPGHTSTLLVFVQTLRIAVTVVDST
jgi:hypothetical protein